MVEVIPIETPTLGDRSYLAHDGEAALVIDPQRDIDRVTAWPPAGVRITHIAETHMHNDYVTGGLALARTSGADYLSTRPTRSASTAPRSATATGWMSAGWRCGCWRPRGTRSPIWPMSWSPAARSPGSSPAGRCCTARPGGPTCSARTHRVLARAQYASAQRLARELPDTAPIFPTHGFGSFCSATQAQSLSSTIGWEKRVNPVLTLDQRYVEALLAGLDAWPAYYAHMAPANLAGPAGPTCPRRAGRTRPSCAGDQGRRVGGGPARPDGVRGRLRARLVQLPARRQLRHLPGLGDPLGHAGDPARRDTSQVGAAQRELVRIGIDRPAAATGQPQDWAARQAAGHPAAGQVRRPGRRPRRPGTAR